MPGARVVGLDFSGAMLERARRKAPQLEWVQGDLLALPYGEDEFDAATVGFGIRNVADLEAGLRELRRVVRPGGRVGILEITRPRGALRVFYSLWFDRVVPLLGRVLPGGEAYTYLPASVRRFPGPEELAAAMRGAGFDDVRYRLFAGGIVALHVATMSGLATLKEAPGLTAFLDELEDRLAAIVGRGEGVVATIGAEALASGGKRLRPALCFLSSPLDAPPPFAAAAAVELLHMATLVHDDVLDAAELRRGRASAWATHGPAAALAGGDYLFARAFAELAATGDEDGLRILAAAAVDLARGEAMQRRQLHDPDTPVDAYLERCALKTGRLFEASCLLASRDERLGAFGLALGVAFQVADDILDCSGLTTETGKIPGTDLRDGTPTLPLILAAREDAVVREALAGGSLDGALLRVGATGALERSREVALDYARRAREHLDGAARADELEALTHLVVDRSA